MIAGADRSQAGRIVYPATLLIVTIAIVFRIYALDRLPGLNGDEAWYGVQAQRWAAGAEMHWRTPTGNLPGPLQFGWLLLLQAIFPPSFVVLRIPAVISSLTTMALAYAIGRRFFDRTTAVIIILLMAALPINILYARLGWDPSHMEFAILLAVCAALAGRPLLCALAFAFSLWVHPTSVFAAPFLTLAFLGAECERRDGKAALLRSGWHVALLILSLSVLGVTTSGNQMGIGLASLGDRLTQPAQWLLFPMLFERLLSGETVYSFVTGRGMGDGTAWADAVSTALLAMLLVAGGATLLRRRFGLAAGIVVGWIASLTAFFLIAGNEALQPLSEHYATGLIVPTVFATAVLTRRLFPDEAGAVKAILLTGAVAAAMLASFYLRFFVVLERQPSTSISTFWTGPREPKQVAFEELLEMAAAGPVRVIAEDWWLYWPIAYLSAGQPMTVINAEWDRPWDGSSPTGTGTYWLVHAGGPMDRALAAQPDTVVRRTIATMDRPATLKIWHRKHPSAK